MTRTYFAYWACITNCSVWAAAGVRFWAGVWLALGITLFVADRIQQGLWPWRHA